MGKFKDLAIDKLNEEKFSKKDLQSALKWAEVVYSEWAKFVKLLKYKIKHKKNGTNTK